MKPRTITEDQFRRGQICFEDLKVCHCKDRDREKRVVESLLKEAWRVLDVHLPNGRYYPENI